MITTVLFDLDGTLLPMDQDRFVQSYLGRMAKKLAPQGFDPDLLVKGIWKGTGAMVKNDGKQLNEAVFWEVFNATLGKDCKVYEELFLDYYRNEFQSVASDCGFAPEAAQVISMLKEKGLQVGLATNPLFPAIATQSRTRWAGLEPEDFELYTTYENSCYCKPNPAYYQEILKKIGCGGSECLMVGNDAVEDCAAEQLGMKVFLLTDCLINKENADLSRYPHGDFDALLAHVAQL